MTNWKDTPYPAPPKNWDENKFGREVEYSALNEVEDVKYAFGTVAASALVIGGVVGLAVLLISLI